MVIRSRRPNSQRDPAEVQVIDKLAAGRTDRGEFTATDWQAARLCQQRLRWHARRRGVPIKTVAIEVGGKIKVIVGRAEEEES